MSNKPIPVFVTPQDVPGAVMSALRAWPEGEMTPSQQKAALNYILNDLCQTMNPADPEAGERVAGYTEGQRRIGITLFNLTGMKVFRDVSEDVND